MTWYANKRTEGPTCVYVIEGGGHCKIGLAMDVSRRIAALQLACPMPLTIKGALMLSGFHEAREIERGLHEAFAYCRVHGEWFDAPAEPILVRLEAYRHREYVPPPPAAAPKPNHNDWTEADHRMVRALEF